jgi:hypothetical protein
VHDEQATGMARKPNATNSTSARRADTTVSARNVREISTEVARRTLRGSVCQGPSSPCARRNAPRDTTTAPAQATRKSQEVRPSSARGSGASSVANMRGWSVAFTAKRRTIWTYASSAAATGLGRNAQPKSVPRSTAARAGKKPGPPTSSFLLRFTSWIMPKATTTPGAIQKRLRWSHTMPAVRSSTCHQRPRIRKESRAMASARESTCGRTMMYRYITLGTATRKSTVHQPAAGTAWRRRTQKTPPARTMVNATAATRIATAGSSSMVKGTSKTWKPHQMSPPRSPMTDCVAHGNEVSNRPAEAYAAAWPMW